MTTQSRAEQVASYVHLTMAKFVYYLGHTQESVNMAEREVHESQRKSWRQQWAEFMSCRLHKCHDKGSRLLEMMLAHDCEAGKLLNPVRDSATSVFLNYNALCRWGYVMHPSAHDELFDTADEISHVLDTIGFESVYAEQGGNNIAVLHQHRSFFFEGEVYDGSNAHFCQIINPASGFIVAVDNVTPPHAGATGKVPDLKFWSDVVFLQWQLCASETSDLRYVLRYNVINTLNTAAVNEINRDNKTMRQKWPGITYQADSKEGKLLIGAPNGSSTAYLLIQHKKQIGYKTIDKITVFEEDEYGLMLLFHITDVKVGSSYIFADE